MGDDIRKLAVLAALVIGAGLVFVAGTALGPVLPSGNWPPGWGRAPATATPKPQSKAIVTAKAKGDGYFSVVYLVPGTKEQPKIVTQQCYNEAAIGMPLPDSCQMGPTPTPPTPTPVAPSIALRFQWGNFETEPITKRLFAGYRVINEDSKWWAKATIRFSLLDKDKREVYTDIQPAGTYASMLEWTQGPDWISPVSVSDGDFYLPSNPRWPYMSFAVIWKWCLEPLDHYCTDNTRSLETGPITLTWPSR